MSPGRPEIASGAVVAFCLPAVEGAVARMLDGVSDAIDATRGASRSASVRIVLAEVLNNIVEHGYRGMPPGSVAVCAGLYPWGVCLEIRDWGRAYPGHELPGGHMPDPKLLQDGGYGWFLIRSLARDISYDRSRGCNHLRLNVPD